MLAFALSLASALSWGISDFLGGLKSRRLHVVAVLLVSQPVGLALALALLPLLAGERPAADHLLVAAAAGAAAVLGLGAFYTALAIGTISVVAPIGALGVAVPVLVGVARGDVPAEAQLAGIALAVAGVVLITREEKEGEPADRAAWRLSLALAGLAALGFGIFFVAIDVAAASDPAWTIAMARAGGVAVVLAAAVAMRPTLGGIRASTHVLIAIGCLDVLANSLYAVATTKGLLPIVAVGGSLYPVFTIGLAHVILGERLLVAQRLGVALAIAGIVLIAAGG